ncbi:MAG: F0F1 ATP synthase subunit B [Actinomycetia bacterium]|nr:F0F1 ATP synthase subunit B [Actinomycetes bacterium]
MKKKALLSAALLVCLALPSVAFAAEGAAAGGPTSILQSPIVPPLGEFVPMLIAFLVVILVLGKFGWPMIIKALDNRAATIENSLKVAEEAKLESENILDEYKAKLAEARSESATITDEARAMAAEQSAKIVADAKAEAKAIVEQAKIAAETMKREAAADIQKQTAEAAVAIAAKLIGSKLDAGQANGLTSKYFAEMGSFNDN